MRNPKGAAAPADPSAALAATLGPVIEATRVRPSDAELVAALRTLVSLVASPAPASTSEFMNANESPAGQRAVREAVKRGELEGFRPGKSLLVRRAAHAEWIESHRVAPTGKAPVSPNLIDRLGTRRAANG